MRDVLPLFQTCSRLGGHYRLLGNGSGTVPIKAAGKQVCHRGRISAAAFERYVIISAPDVLLELFEFDDSTAPANIGGRVKREP
jgi:hypothetical protein